MVLYHADGKVVVAHENYLEQNAHQRAYEYRYIDQIDIVKKARGLASTEDVRLIIDEQSFTTLYKGCWEGLDFRQTEPEEIKLPVGRKTLVACSGLAAELFAYEPGQTEIHLPVRFPRKHEAGQSNLSRTAFTESYPGRVLVNGKHYLQEAQMAFIRSDEVREYILPWLRRVQKDFEGVPAGQSGRQTEREEGSASPSSGPNTISSTSPRIQSLPIPTDLLWKIHLYNCALQLAIPPSLVQPLTDALILQMYQTPLSHCHLDTLEITVGRFHSHSIAVLDPVLNHLTGTYAQRSILDRTNPHPPASLRHTSRPSPDSEPDPNSLTAKEHAGDPKRTHDAHDDPTDFSTTKRRRLAYATEPARERIAAGFTRDTLIMPPALPVLGHCVQHWSGVRRNGSTAAAYTGFPLNVGTKRKVVSGEDGSGALEQEELHRLKGVGYYLGNAPGGKGGDEDDAEGDEEVEGRNGAEKGKGKEKEKKKVVIVIPDDESIPV
ncbi:hypothetical protein ACN47E_001755 [Coniothyrium glycines]